MPKLTLRRDLHSESQSSFFNNVDNSDLPSTDNDNIPAIAETNCASDDVSVDDPSVVHLQEEGEKQRKEHIQEWKEF